MAHSLDMLEAAQRRLSDAVTRLKDATGRSRHLADQTDWRTDAATMFHFTADALRRDVARLSERVESVRDEVRSTRARVEADMWRPGG
jgi:hypothetical protein